jgi:nicotinamide-nucleotide amidase
MSSPEIPSADDAGLGRLAAALGAALLRAGLRLTVAESCTGGWIAKVLTDVPGSSDWFDSSVVSYSNPAKTSALGVLAATLATHGAVSEAVVREMTAGAKRATGCPAALAVSGVAGPGGGSDDKPVGLVHFAWSLGDRDWVERRELAGDREAVRRQAAALAIARLLAALEGPPPG